MQWTDELQTVIEHEMLRDRVDDPHLPPRDYAVMARDLMETQPVIPRHDDSPIEPAFVLNSLDAPAEVLRQAIADIWPHMPASVQEALRARLAAYRTR